MASLGVLVNSEHSVSLLVRFSRQPKPRGVIVTPLHRRGNWDLGCICWVWTWILFLVTSCHGVKLTAKTRVYKKEDFLGALFHLWREDPSHPLIGQFQKGGFGDEAVCDRCLLHSFTQACGFSCRQESKYRKKAGRSNVVLSQCI